METETRKQKPGQAGAADTHPYLRTERLEIRISPHEKNQIQQNSVDCGFDSVAQYVRGQAVARQTAESPTGIRKELIRCQYQLNRIGNNVNQIARHLNQGASLDEEILLTLMQIQELADRLVQEAKGQHGGRT